MSQATRLKRAAVGLLDAWRRTGHFPADHDSLPPQLQSLLAGGSDRLHLRYALISPARARFSIDPITDLPDFVTSPLLAPWMGAAVLIAPKSVRRPTILRNHQVAEVHIPLPASP